MRSELPFAVLLLALAGCSDAHAFHYSYKGRLLDSQGNPAVNVELYVTRSDGLAWKHGDKPEFNYKEQDTWAAFGTRTGEDGSFHCMFQVCETYSRWLGAVPPVSPPAKTLDDVYVVVHRGDEWVPILVPLEANMQPNGHDGGRQIDLPTVMIPAGK